ncbi:hypothetical protein VNO78_23376 [Psophocarpus tetragonolobus]|uniref:Uncharacterized protein n=1 Tax=Psophocarpus tetragonolobus TaxID=3891 RepID=A0AAN9XDT4_PSOTE
MDEHMAVEKVHDVVGQMGGMDLGLGLVGRGDEVPGRVGRDGSEVPVRVGRGCSEVLDQVGRDGGEVPGRLAEEDETYWFTLLPVVVVSNRVILHVFCTTQFPFQQVKKIMRV